MLATQSVPAWAGLLTLWGMAFVKDAMPGGAVSTPEGAGRKPLMLSVLSPSAGSPGAQQRGQLSARPALGPSAGQQRGARCIWNPGPDP